MDTQQRHTADLIAEATRLIEQGVIKTPTDVADHFTMEEIAAITAYMVRHFTTIDMQEVATRLIERMSTDDDSTP
jgi:NADPH:quinone reductase-like Zn-dependent oxidoreductase